MIREKELRSRQNGYLKHASRANHDYIAKVTIGANKYKYFYDQASYNAYKSGKNVKTQTSLSNIDKYTLKPGEKTYAEKQKAATTKKSDSSKTNTKTKTETKTTTKTETKKSKSKKSSSSSSSSSSKSSEVSGGRKTVGSGSLSTKTTGQGGKSGSSGSSGLSGGSSGKMERSNGTDDIQDTSGDSILDSYDSVEDLVNDRMSEILENSTGDMSVASIGVGSNYLSSRILLK